jgi:hypothetical protein
MYDPLMLLLQQSSGTFRRRFVMEIRTIGMHQSWDFLSTQPDIGTYTSFLENRCARHAGYTFILDRFGCIPSWSASEVNNSLPSRQFPIVRTSPASRRFLASS